jgi:hypothetical protein
MGRPIKHQISIGKRFGHLVAISEPHSHKKQRYVECRCDCGNVAVIRTEHLHRPRRQHCGNQCSLLATKRVGDDITGQKFGRWTVISFVGIDQHSIWKCLCDCGTVRDIPAAYLRIGNTKSCGCLVVDMLRKYTTPEAKKEALRANSRRSGRKHAARVKANKIKYETKRSHATPPWLSLEDWDAMDALYERARRLSKETGVRHEVDHIYPLQGKMLSGLHVPWNLQILTQAENVAKSNRYAELYGDVEK